MSDAFYGLYSNSGFDLLAILTKVASRKNPTIDLGPIDLSCSFVVSDAQKIDMPIVYVSSNFETLTGYKSEEILGKNCRFLQAPGGDVRKGEERKFADGRVVYEMKRSIETAKECQFLNVNYKKSGEPFVNLITVIPVSLDEQSGVVTHFVGFQVDLLEQSNSILSRISDDRYVVNYKDQVLENIPNFIIETYGTKKNNDQDILPLIPSLTQAPANASPFVDIPEVIINGSFDTESNFVAQDIHESLDFIHILSSRGLVLFTSDYFREKVLQYDSKELIGKNISEFCHPGDLGSLMKDLKGANIGEKVPTMYRFKTKYGGYIWLDIIGQKYELPNSKKIKCFLLNGRTYEVSTLPHRMLVDNLIYLNRTPDFWLKITYHGLIVFASSVCVWNPFGISNAKLFGTSIYEYLSTKSILDLKNSLNKATANCPILLSVGSRTGEQLALSVYPSSAFIFLRVKSTSVDTNSYAASPDALYPSSALYVDVFLPIAENSSLGLKFEMNKLHASNKMLEDEIRNLGVEKFKRKFS